MQLDFNHYLLTTNHQPVCDGFADAGRPLRCPPSGRLAALALWPSSSSAWGSPNTTVSVVNAVLLRPPFANADRVVRLHQDSDEGAPGELVPPRIARLLNARGLAAPPRFRHHGHCRSPSQTVVCRVREARRLSLCRLSACRAVGLPGGRRPRRPSSATTPGYASALIRTCLAHHAARWIGGHDRGVGPRDYNGIVNGTAVDFWLPLAARSGGRVAPRRRRAACRTTVPDPRTAS